MKRGIRVFISYRRDDAAGYARAIYDELVRRFSDERVFMDADDIAAGLPFDEVIRGAVGQSQVLLVLIGKRWMGESPDAPSRLHDPADFVRAEIEAGLSRGLRVIPVLLDGAAMPRAEVLPESLRPLARRHALEMVNARFADDMQRLLAAVHEAIGEPPKPPASLPSRWKRLLVLAAAGGLAAGLALGIGYFFRPGHDRPDINGVWQAQVRYDWPNADYLERFVFAGDAAELHGTASFLGADRGIVDGGVDAGTVRFTTRTTEIGGNTAPVESVHRYRGTVAGNEIRFVMQTEGGLSAHVPIEFIARRFTP
ncbi:toll/interleukin-1 receptor domain-containing protein [Piscinibacter sp. XHJ-5]|uniref:toll/interleukin-1 receptor domain-containing protein n=1 Tax=Piscinibacter sp. XHJ-5 TaxID=3037797 RepID=UPI0024528107|nr:toll/interleukin-1 receptor domain-containing protein [Piscinibacter sp. XHJ-5]